MDNKILVPALCCNILSFITGIALTWSSPIVVKLTSADYLLHNPFGRLLSTNETSWIGSILSFGTLFGLIFCLGANKFGRKWMILFFGIPPLIAYLLFAFAEIVELYYVGRVLVGISIAGTYTIVPMYISEISEDKNRGTFGGLLGTLAALGSLFAYCVGPYLSILWFNIICAIFPAVFLVMFFVFAPESPYYYMLKGDEQRCEDALRKLRSGDYKNELLAIKESIGKTRNGSLLDIFRSKGLRKAIITSLSLVLFQQLTGVTAVLFYAQTIFEASGSKIDSAISSIIIGAVEAVGSVTPSLLADRFGRRMLFLISSIGMIISDVSLGVYFYLKDDDQDVSNIYWLPVVSLVLCIITYNFAFSGLPMVVMSEVLPISVKSSASTMTVAFSSILVFVITRYFQNVSDAIGMGESFWIFAGCCCCALLFVLFYLIETKGKSFQEIQDILES